MRSHTRVNGINKAVRPYVVTLGRDAVHDVVVTPHGMPARKAYNAPGRKRGAVAGSFRQTRSRAATPRALVRLRLQNGAENEAYREETASGVTSSRRAGQLSHR